MCAARLDMAFPPFAKGGQGGFEPATRDHNGRNPPRSPFFKRGGWRRRGLALLAALACIHVRADDLPPLTHALTPIAQPYAAPALKLPDLDGRVHDLADLRGRVVVVNFWATWCPPCRREMPSLERLRQRLADKGLAVIAVDVGEDADTVFSFTGQLEPAPSFPLLLDRDSAAMQRWKVKGLPTTFVVDAQGRVVRRAVGGREFDHEALLGQLMEFLPGR
ncbi:MAG TPA: TlpA disulfide reductase family protein [Thiobacillaceae bacterium]|nr:TlpA disulfide reductase family protein [Thiobacillaceae bacterium]